MFFSVASDHLFEFMPEYAPKGLQKRCERFKKFCLDRKIPIYESDPVPDNKDFSWAVSEARTLLRLIDKKNGVPTIKGEAQ
jgi:hypothetical protein